MPSLRPIVALVTLLAAEPAWGQPTLTRDKAGKMPDSIRPFVDRLYAADPRQRAEAACELGKREWESTVAIPILLTMLHDEVTVPALECNMSPWLRREIQVSADARKWSETSPAKEAADTLGEIGDAAVPGLVQALGSNDSRVRRFAAYGLGEAEPQGNREATEALTRALRDADPRVRAMAAWAQGEIEDPAAVPGLVVALKDSDVELRKKAAWALGEIESEAAVNGLVFALRDADAGVRRQAAWALGEIESAAAVTPLAGALKDADWQVRKQAAWALGEIEDASAVPALQAARYDANVEVRAAVVNALRELRDQE